MASAFDNGVVGVPVAVGTTASTWASVAIPEGARVAHIRLKTTDAFICPTPSSTDPTQNGCSYPVNCPIALPLGVGAGANRELHFKRDGSADGEIHVTFLG